MEIRKGQIILELSERGLYAPAEMIKLLEIGHGIFLRGKVCDQIFIVISKPDLYNAQPHCKSSFFIVRGNVIESLMCLQILAGYAVIVRANSLSGQDECMVYIKLLRGRKRNVLKEGISGEDIFSAYQEELAGVYDVSKRIKTVVATVSNVEDLPIKDISVGHAAQSSVLTHLSSGRYFSVQIAFFKQVE